MGFDRKAVKQCARRHLRGHYLLLVTLCALSIFLGTEFTGIVTSAQTWYDVLTGQVTQLSIEGIREARTNANVKNITDMLSDNLEARTGANVKIITDMISDNLEAGKEEAAIRMRRMKAESDPNSALGRSRGIFAAVMNNISSGNLFATLGSAIHSIIRSQRAVAVIMVLLSAVFYALVWIFIRNVYGVILRRAYLETRVYNAYPLSHVLHLRLVRRWKRAALTLLLKSVYELLWGLTVVGYCVKRYSYFLVPFIVAENPDIAPKEAIALSRRLMDGHKKECFLLELSFVGWHLLSFVTFGAVDVLWAVPYELAAYSEYYARVRAEAGAGGIPGAELLNDECLFERAPEATLRARYADVTRFEGVLDEDILELPPLKRFFAKTFGIWVGTMEEKKVFSRQAGLRQQTRVARKEMNGEVYPERLTPLWNREAAAITGKVSYLAPCTVWSLVVVFFSFCLVGWVWEVSLHLISHGEFVNRGMLHGPWLPIYGGGVVMISVLLFAFRRKPALEAVLVVLLCGFVEYMTSYVTELSTGMRWWDYTGYFLNLNGRICGEGLAAFAVGGMAAVYFLVPHIDSAVTRVKPKILIPICVALLALFAGDLVYSHFVPNVGPGITDTAEEAQAVEDGEALAIEPPTEE